MLRQVLNGERDDLLPPPADGESQPVRTFSQDTTLRIPRRPDPDEDWALLGEVGRRINDAIAAADHLRGEERQTFVERRLAEVEAELGSGP